MNSGGYCCNNVFDEILSYNSTKDQWTVAGTMPGPRFQVKLSPIAGASEICSPTTTSLQRVRKGLAQVLLVCLIPVPWLGVLKSGLCKHRASLSRRLSARGQRPKKSQWQYQLPDLDEQGPCAGVRGGTRRRDGCALV